MKNIRKRAIFLGLSLIALTLGIIIYLFVVQDNRYYYMAASYLYLPQITVKNPYLKLFLCWYSADLLWAVAFTFCNQMIFLLEGKKIAYLLLTNLLGILYEIFQFLNPLYGTFDINDILIYVCGNLFSILLILIINRKTKKENFYE